MGNFSYNNFPSVNSLLDDSYHVGVQVPASLLSCHLHKIFLLVILEGYSNSCQLVCVLASRRGDSMRMADSFPFKCMTLYLSTSLLPTFH